MMDIAGIDPREWNMDGDSLLPYLSGEQGEWKDEVFCEHLAHGTEGPQAMVRQGDWKLSYTHLDEPEFELYDLARDPGEFTNLAGQPETTAIQDRLFARIGDLWPDPDALAQAIRESQEERYLLRELTGGGEERLF